MRAHYKSWALIFWLVKCGDLTRYTLSPLPFPRILTASKPLQSLVFCKAYVPIMLEGQLHKAKWWNAKDKGPQDQPLYYTVIHWGPFSLASCVLGSMMGPGRGLITRQTSLPLWSFTSGGAGTKLLGNRQEWWLPIAMSTVIKNESGGIHSMA